MRLKDKISLVTGSSKGIGRAIALAMADEGASIVITGRDRETLAQAATEIGGDTTGIVCDVAKSIEIESLVAQVLKDFGRVDTLVNVAGVNRRKPAPRRRAKPVHAGCQTLGSTEYGDE